MNIYENQWKSMEIYENHWKYMKIEENIIEPIVWKSLKIDENVCKPSNIYANQCKMNTQQWHLNESMKSYDPSLQASKHRMLEVGGRGGSL